MPMDFAKFWAILDKNSKEKNTVFAHFAELQKGNSQYTVKSIQNSVSFMHM